MRRRIGTIAWAAVAALLGLGQAPAVAQTSHGSHAGHESHGGAGQGAGGGVLIRESTVQGHAFVYRLYSWEERNAMMKGMEGHSMPGMDDTGKATNHLMLFIRDPKGAEVSGAKVGFLIVGPGKSEQKTLTMGMSGGYGADVVLKEKGKYEVTAKAVAGDKTLTEKFEYLVK